MAVPDRLLWVAVGGVMLWGVWAFGSETVLNLRLNQQVASLRAQNEHLAESNEQARRDLKAAESPATMEEAARRQGFARPGEQVYIIKPSPSAAVPAGAGAAVDRGAQSSATQRGGGNILESIARWLGKRWQ